MKGDKIILGISQGDINGISYEVIIKSLADNRIFDLCIPVVYGSPKVAAYHKKALDLENFSFNTIRTAEEAVPKKANIINCIDDSVRVELGKSTPFAGEASFQALEAAVKDLSEGKIDVIVTAPINKANIKSEKFNFNGHTEYFETRFRSEGVLMLMVNELMRIGVVTSHIPLSKVTEYITKDIILHKLRIMSQSLLSDFGIRRPRIAVLGLNPHSGDNGLIGDEEIREIIPAIAAARDEGILAFGPFPADGFFGAATFTKYDGILAMYHDQGLVPFKALTSEGGVNFTAGLTIVRTSPAHGTAYNITGKNEASPDSFRKAIYLACDIFSNRQQYREISANPLNPLDLSEI
ncbi:MAG TPA: 4-hydroxythreonine-4-phosphate dehydrogenase PdxA [Bacteroidales bacterium]|jgi:4-hydroxythreonine-4-phosphate dehydrogenase|nr:4-hydroxythreonine-4-phosphate dehydrogenase PdxA [Bacteroidales bacterium]